MYEFVAYFRINNLNKQLKLAKRIMFSGITIKLTALM